MIRCCHSGSTSMNSPSRSQKTTHESSAHLTTSIQPRPFSAPNYEQPQAVGYNFSHVDLFAHAPVRGPIQRKLTIGQPRDEYEQEADRVAEQVMNMSDSATQLPMQRQAELEDEELQTKPLSALITPVVQRESLPGEEEEPVQAKRDLSTINLFAHDPGPRPAGRLNLQAKLTIGEANNHYEQEADRVAAQVVDRINAPSLQSPGEQQSVQRMGAEEEELQMMPIVQRVGAEGGSVTEDLEGEINAARGGGQSLAPELQMQMGQAMGADFSGVRVHTDGRSDELNQSIQAKAFTTGQDIFFRQGAYDPGSRGGQELIAHELTHVVQQNGGAVQRLPLENGKEEITKEHKGVRREALRYEVLVNSTVQRQLEYVPGQSRGEEHRAQAPLNSDMYVQCDKEYERGEKDTPGKLIEVTGEGNFGVRRGWLFYMMDGDAIWVREEDKGYFEIDYPSAEYFHMGGESEKFEEQEKSESSGEKEEYIAPEEIGTVRSISIRQENKGDHMYVIAMIKGGPNIKMELGNGGHFIKIDHDISDQFGQPIGTYKPKEGLTDKDVIAKFEEYKGKVEFHFTDYNCQRYAFDIAGELGTPENIDLGGLF